MHGAPPAAQDSVPRPVAKAGVAAISAIATFWLLQSLLSTAFTLLARLPPQASILFAYARRCCRCCGPRHS